MAPPEGIEPPSVPCKGTALPLDERRKMVRVARFELATSCSQSRRNEPGYPTLGKTMVEMERIELSIPACKTGVFPLALHPHYIGSGGWARSSDIWFNRPTLYQLSYSGTENLERRKGIEPLS